MAKDLKNFGKRSNKHKEKISHKTRELYQETIGILGIKDILKELENQD
jgi:hypothetical protein